LLFIYEMRLEDGWSRNLMTAFQKQQLVDASVDNHKKKKLTRRGSSKKARKLGEGLVVSESGIWYSLLMTEASSFTCISCKTAPVAMGELMAV
jgi:hypothetical protein